MFATFAFVETPPATPRTRVRTPLKISPAPPGSPPPRVCRFESPPPTPHTAKVARESDSPPRSYGHVGCGYLATPPNKYSQMGSGFFEIFETPPNKYNKSQYTPPQRQVPVVTLPSLMTALSLDSVEGVRSVLEHDPDAARLPIFEQFCEHPLCCAIRLQCSIEIIRLLLEHGADVSAADNNGQTPLQKIRFMRGKWQKVDFEYFVTETEATAIVLQQKNMWRLKVEQLLAESAGNPVVGG